MDTRHIHLARMRIQLEYIEMPNLKLTLPQVRRLCDLPHEICVAAVSSLVTSGVLTLARDGSFLRPGIEYAESIGGPRVRCEKNRDAIAKTLRANVDVAITLYRNGSWTA